MKTNKLGFLLILLFPILDVVLWMLTPKENFPVSENFSSQYWAEVIASAGMILMGIALILAAKPKFLEPLFGGLDKMYKGHKLAAILGFLLIILHKFTIPESGDEGFGPKLGMIGLIGFVVLIVLTLVSNRIKYNTWKKSHKFIGLFFIVGIVHTFMVDNLLQFAPMPSVLTRIVSFVAVFAYIYQEALRYILNPDLKYFIVEVNRLNDQIVELVMSPKGKSLAYKAGQFISIKFNRKELNEYHPFTICSAPNDEYLKLSIKSSGDFTTALYQSIEEGDVASIQGAYGKLDYATGTEKQIWIAGGIGITPFLSWVRSLQPNEGKEIHLFYTVRTVEEAIFINEFEKATNGIKNFNFHLWLSNDKGHLNGNEINKIKNVDSTTAVYLCGPLKMTQNISKQLIDLGVKKENTHFEEFNFK